MKRQVSRRSFLGAVVAAEPSVAQAPRDHAHWRSLAWREPFDQPALLGGLRSGGHRFPRGSLMRVRRMRSCASLAAASVER